MNIYLEDRIKGLIYGQAIGDAMGLGTEFLNKQQIRLYYPYKLSDFSQIIQDKHRSRWQKGDWTDDTDQMLCILDSILEHQKVDYLDIAQKIHDWAYNGGKGIGNTVYQVLTHPSFINNSQQVAQLIWEKSNRQMAANGAVMRTAILGVWECADFEKVRKNTEEVAKITHFDPRCVGSCVAVTFAISQLLQGNQNIEQIFEESIIQTKNYDTSIADYLQMAQIKSIQDFDLDEPNSIGYTLKAMGVGFWALRKDSFEEAIIEIIHEGGDADTNAAVAGAILGAKLGYAQLPEKWISGLNKKNILDQKIAKLLTLMQLA
jgi:ADP-ribosylglycohydrolase